jgi:leucyl aminopeptidase (aminopeptidase T)
MKGVADTGFAVESGQATLFPGGEGSVSPVAESAEGTVVIDGSIPEIGRLSAPITVAVKKGFVYRVSGGPEADKLRKLFTLHGKQARNLAEVGIGTNPLAQVTGKTLEDEKALGTAHVAFGNNLSFEGKIGVRCHIDAVFLKPTLCIDGRCIVENGSINV